MRHFQTVSRSPFILYKQLFKNCNGYTFENVCRQAYETLRLKCVFLKCLSPQFVLYFQLSYDGQRPRVYMIFSTKQCLLNVFRHKILAYCRALGTFIILNNFLVNFLFCRPILPNFQPGLCCFQSTLVFRIFFQLFNIVLV